MNFLKIKALPLFLVSLFSLILIDGCIDKTVYNMANFNVVVNDTVFDYRTGANYLLPPQNPYAVCGKITLLDYNNNTGELTNKTIDLYAIDLSIFRTVTISPVQNVWYTGSFTYDYSAQAPNLLIDFPQAKFLPNVYQQNLKVKHASSTPFVGVITSLDTAFPVPQNRVGVNFAHVTLGAVNPSLEVSGYVRLYFYDGSLITEQP
jgi:hypothetical protein